MIKNSQTRVLFISHGGGPMPLLGDEGHREMVDNLRHVTTLIGRPSAIIVISAHWEQAIASVTSGANPALIYDYYGFPEASYDIRYPCPGEPSLAVKICQAFNDAGIASTLNSQRGFDHGLFVPLKIMYPAADIPCVQLSLLGSLDPAQHIQMGKALASVEYGSLLIIGSGFSFHNMKAFFTPDTSETKNMNEAFERWLIEACSSNEIDEVERTQRLEHWQQAPFARYCHPREEHLLPLHVCYGVAQTACNEYYQLRIMDKLSSIYLW